MLSPLESYGLPTKTTPTKLEAKVQTDLEEAVAAEEMATVTTRSIWGQYLHTRAKAANAACI